MGGGLLNLVSEGNKNVILNGNPSKTFFKTTYAKYTNFGMDKQRIDVNGSRKLSMINDSQFLFQIPREADLLMDTYFVVQLPNIWSPIREILPGLSNEIMLDGKSYTNNIDRNFWPYEFKWIENLGAQMIRRIRYKIGGEVIQEFTGHYLYNMVQRDFSETKKKLFDEMIGNTKELNDPANYGGRNNVYPNAIYNQGWKDYGGPEPSIRARKIYVPLNIWATLSSKLAFPLVSLYKNVLRIEITCRPIQELFVVRYQPSIEIRNTYNEIMLRINNGIYVLEKDIRPKWTFEKRQNKLNDIQFVGRYVRANQNLNRYSFYRFVNPPVSPEDLIHDQLGSRIKNGTVSGTMIDYQAYDFPESLWNADCHLLCTFGYLSERERDVFKSKAQNYLIRFINEWDFLSLQEKNSLRIDSFGLVSSWMWFFQRSDIDTANKWSNYTNWYNENELPFKGITDLIGNPRRIVIPRFTYDLVINQFQNSTSPASYDTINLSNFVFRWIYKSNGESNKLYYDNLPKPFIFTGPQRYENKKEILKNFSIVIDGKVRENTFTSDIYNFVEKYIRTPGNGKNGLYCYNFTLNTDPLKMQPSGAINLNFFRSINFECEILKPEIDENASTKLIVDNSNETIAINRGEWNIFKQTYNMHLMQERYKLLTFEDGNITINSLT